MSPPDNQQQLRLLAAPRPMTVELLFRQFGTVLIPVEDVRAWLCRYLNTESFDRALGTARLPLPVTTVDDSNRALPFIEIHHLAAYVDNCAGLADAALVRKLSATQPADPPNTNAA